MKRDLTDEIIFQCRKRMNLDWLLEQIKTMVKNMNTRLNNFGVNVASTETLDPDEGAWVTSTREGDKFTLAFGIPKGDKGDTGDPAPAGISDIFKSATDGVRLAGFNKDKQEWTISNADLVSTDMLSTPQIENDGVDLAWYDSDNMSWTVNQEAITNGLGYLPVDLILLYSDGIAIYSDSEMTQEMTFAEVKALLDDEKNDVHLYNGNYILKPEYSFVKEGVSAIWFNAVTSLDDIPYIYRITINSNDEVINTEYPLQKKLIAGTNVTIGADGRTISATGGSVNDVTLDGTSCVEDGVAKIPLASSSALGVAMFNQYYGVEMSTYSKSAQIKQAAESEITQRQNAFKPITSNNLDYAVKAALTDGKGAAYTDTEKAAARDRIGAVSYDEMVAYVDSVLVGIEDGEY